QDYSVKITYATVNVSYQTETYQIYEATDPIQRAKIAAYDATISKIGDAILYFEKLYEKRHDYAARLTYIEKITDLLSDIPGLRPFKYTAALATYLKQVAHGDEKALHDVLADLRNAREGVVERRALLRGQAAG